MSNTAFVPFPLPLETKPGTTWSRLVSQSRADVESTRLLVATRGANLGAQPTGIKGIVRTPGVYGGWPCIEGHRIAVHDIAEYVQQGYNAQRIVSEIYPHLSLVQVAAAIHYYYEYQEEIDREIAEDIVDVRWLAQESMSPFAQKLRQHIKERREQSLREKGLGA